MQSVIEMMNPRVSFTGYGTQEQLLRQSYLTVDELHLDRREDAGIIRASAVLLELYWVAACVYSEARRRAWAIETLSSEQLSELEQLAVGTTHIDPKVVAHDAFEHLGPPDLESTAVPRFSGVLRALRSMLVACPIDAIEYASVRLDMVPWGHRCRVAYAGIQAFLLRCDDDASERVRIVGRQYAEGSLTIEEVARVLEMHVIDAVAELEAKGFARDLSVIALSKNDRQVILDRIRKDRELRSGIFRSSREAIARDVVASERIEGVDARRWISREGR